MNYRQAVLRSGTQELVGNLPEVPGLREGKYVTLRDDTQPDRRWRIDWLSAHSREHGALDRERRGAASWAIH